jgi:hypothetical protein
MTPAQPEHWRTRALAEVLALRLGSLAEPQLVDAVAEIMRRTWEEAIDAADEGIQAGDLISSAAWAELRERGPK